MNGIVSGKIEKKQSISDTVPTSVIGHSAMTLRSGSTVSIKNYRCVSTFWALSIYSNYYIFPQGKYIILGVNTSGQQSGQILTGNIQDLEWINDTAFTVNFNEMTITVTRNTVQFLAW